MVRGILVGSLALTETSYYGQSSLSVGAFYAMMNIFMNFSGVLVLCFSGSLLARRWTYRLAI